MKTTGIWLRSMQEGRGKRDSRPAEREGMQCGFMQVGGWLLSVADRRRRVDVWQGTNGWKYGHDRR